MHAHVLARSRCLVEKFNDDLRTILGRRGSPRKLTVRGEEMGKVVYRLQDAESYRDCRILVVGGGDSAIEAAVALARQNGNSVTISYRRKAFVRLKEKNEKNITQLVQSGKIRALMGSVVLRISEKHVLLDIGGRPPKPEKDFVFVIAGAEPPTEFLKKAKVGFRSLA